MPLTIEQQEQLSEKFSEFGYVIFEPPYWFIVCACWRRQRRSSEPVCATSCQSAGAL